MKLHKKILWSFIMVMVLGQDIPSDQLIHYRRSLIPAVDPISRQYGTRRFGSERYGPPESLLYKNKYGDNYYHAHQYGTELYPHLARATSAQQMQFVRKRMAHIWPRMQNDSPFSPSAAQRKVRAAFKECCNCFNIQPWSGGAEPDGTGPYSRTWWYEQAGPSGLWYYDYFIQQSWATFYADTTPPWCQLLISDNAHIAYCQPDTNFPPETEIGVARLRCPLICHQRAYFGFGPETQSTQLHIYVPTRADQFQNDPPILQAWGVTDKTWTENTLTWNNAPGYATLLFEQLVASGTWITIPLGIFPSTMLKLQIESCWQGSPTQIHIGYTLATNIHGDKSKRPFFTP